MIGLAGPHFERPVRRVIVTMIVFFNLISVSCVWSVAPQMLCCHHCHILNNKRSHLLTSRWGYVSEFYVLVDVFLFVSCRSLVLCVHSWFVFCTVSFFFSFCFYSLCVSMDCPPPFTHVAVVCFIPHTNQKPLSVHRRWSVQTIADCPVLISLPPSILLSLTLFIPSVSHSLRLFFFFFFPNPRSRKSFDQGRPLVSVLLSILSLICSCNFASSLIISDITLISSTN